LTLYPADQHIEGWQAMFSKSDKGTQMGRPQNTTQQSVNVAARRRSVIQDDITISGDLVADGILEFGGVITGDVTADTLVLSKNGVINGNIRARNVTIEGVQSGGTITGEAVSLKVTARVAADITCRNLEIESGAQVEGYLRVQGAR
jgi:cytoskeletal protein CcmA (bactofilin family)